jgi:hypothetical protein
LEIERFVIVFEKNGLEGFGFHFRAKNGLKVLSMYKATGQAVGPIFNPKEKNRLICEWSVCDAVAVADGSLSILVTISSKASDTVPDWRVGHIHPI